MTFPKVETLFIVTMLLHHVEEVNASLLTDDDASLRIEDLLVEFMTDLKKSNLDKLHIHHLMLLGKNKIFLQATKVVLDDHTAYLVANGVEAATRFSYWDADSVVLYFIDELSDSTVSWSFAKLPNSFGCRTLLISTSENVTYEKISTVMKTARRMRLRNVSFARLDGREIKIYREELDGKCRFEVTVTNVWTPGSGFSNKRSVFDRLSGTVNGLGCPLVVSTMSITPTMILQNDRNNVTRITGGIEGHLILILANQMNFVPVLKVPSVDEQWWVAPNGSILGIVGEVAEDKAHLGIGQIRPTPERAEIVDFTGPYNHECIVWTLPMKTKYNDILFSVFSPYTWTLIILTVLFTCFLTHVASRLETRNHRRCHLTILDVISLSLTYAIPRQPAGFIGKLFFLLYLKYSRVISTAYSTSLASVLATSITAPMITDERGILDGGLRTAGTQSSRHMLADQIDPNSTRAGLLSRFEVITSIGEALGRLSAGENIAYLRHLSTINQAGATDLSLGKPMTYYPLHDCVISYSAVIVTPKGSSLTGDMNKLLMRISQSGIYQYWMHIDKTAGLIGERSYTHSGYFSSYSLARLRPIFLLYLFCLIPAVLTFTAELIVFNLRINGLTR